MIASRSVTHDLMLTVCILLCVDAAWSSVCNESVPADQLHCDRIYPLYKKLETIVTNDKETLYTMKQAFFPTLEPHFWESTRVNVVLIRVCVIMDETMMKCNSSGGKSSMFIKTQCWNYQWSSSPALTRITSGQLFAFDSVFAPMIYHYFVGGRFRHAHILLHIHSAVFPCIPMEREFTRAVVLLLSWSKAYAKAQGLPATWSEEDQGYIAQSYGYYDAEGYGTHKAGLTIWKLLLTVFILLNLLLLYTTVTHGKKWYCSLYDTMKESFVQVLKIYSTAGISMAIFNFFYFTSSVLLLIRYYIYPSHCIDHDLDNCTPPRMSSYYKDEVTALIVKGVVNFIAIITQLLVAILISRKAILPMANRCSRVFQIILLWNTFGFVQIWVGLILLPACIFLIIAPLQTIPILCAAIALTPVLMLFISTLLWLANKVHIRNWDYKINAMVCIHSSRYMVFVALIVALVILYFNLSPGGTTLSSTKGIIFSFLPSIFLSMTAWGIKRRFFNSISGKAKKTRAERSVRSVPTEQEDPQATEQNVLLNNVVDSDEEPTSSPLTEDSQIDISSIV